MADVPKPEDLIKIDYQPPKKPWMDTKPEFREGTYCKAASPKWLETVDYPHAREWSVTDDDWKLPDSPAEGAYPEAVLTGTEWTWIGWRTDDGEEYGEIDWPFAKPWADYADMEALGFVVVFE